MTLLRVKTLNPKERTWQLWESKKPDFKSVKWVRTLGNLVQARIAVIYNERNILERFVLHDQVLGNYLATPEISYTLITAYDISVLEFI